MSGVIANASPLINLSLLDYLHLLEKFHSGVFIPPAVWDEVVVAGKNRPGVKEVKKAREEEWLSVVAPENEVIITTLEKQLDVGEAETIALAIEKDIEWVLLDESDARAVAESYDLKMTGTIGILLRAYKTGIVESVEEVLDQLQEEANFRISDTLYEKVIKLARDM
jgi:hypothetical protein